MADTERPPPHLGEDHTIQPIRPGIGVLDRPVRGAHRSGPPRSGVTLGRTAVPLLAAVGALFGAFAPGAPTGVRPMDLALKAALVAVCALAGCVVAWPFVALAAVVVVAGAVNSPGVVAAVAVLGLALAGWRATGWRGTESASGEPFVGVMVLRVAACAVIGELTLRLTWPHVSLVPSALGALASLLLVVPAVARSPRRIRRVIMVVAGLVLVLVAALSTLAGVSALRAKADLTNGIAQAKLAIRIAAQGRQTEAIAAFSAAQRDFVTAYNDLGWSRAAELVPVVSQQVRALRHGAAIAVDLTRAGLSTAHSTNMSELRVTDGVFPLVALERLQPYFRADLAVLNQSLSNTGQFQSPWLLSPLKRKLSAELGTLREAQKVARTGLLASQAVPPMLGADGPRRYLILFENPAESRASGGVIGDYAVVTADAGRLKLQVVGSVGQLDTAGNIATRHLIGPADYIARYSHFEPQDYWENVPMSPDFPSVAQVAANLFPQSGGEAVDGVISVDPAAMAGFLEMTGPIKTPGWPTPLNSANVVQVLANREFIAFGNDYPAHITFVQTLVHLVWHALLSQKLPVPAQMAADLRPAVAGGHLLVWTRSATEEQLLQRVNLSGAMPPVRGDFFGVVTQNAGGNKIDWYLRRSISYQAHLDRSSGRLTATLTVHLHNLSPSSGLPSSVIGSIGGVKTTPGESELYVSLYSPWGATGASVNGSPLVLTTQQELGRLVYSALVTVPPGGTTTIVLHLAGQWPSGGGAYRVSWYRQPMLFPDQVSTQVTVSGGVTGRR